VSTAGNLGLIFRVAARLARQQVGRSRTLGAIGEAARTTLRTFSRILHHLWLEVTGAIFMFMAGVGGIEIAREWVKYRAGQATSARVAVAICFTLTFAWFGVTSFWRVRKGRSARQ
jgi:hypothetical protein